MSTIDQAFVKAFRKNRQAIDSTGSPELSEEARAAALGMSTIWIDPSSEQQWRADQAHSQPQDSANNRSRGAAPGRPAQPATPRHSHSVTGSDARDPSKPIQPVTTGVPPSPAPDAKRNDENAETAIDIHMFDAIDVTPSPFAVFSQSEAVAESPATEAGNSHDATAQEKADGDCSVPHSVPFVKIHQRAASDSDETAVGAASPETASPANEVPAVEEAQPFEAAWEVDRFEHPPVVKRLLDEEGLVADAVAPLVEACRGGLQTLVITSSAPQQGRTTLATGLAMATARAGLRVALLDLDTQRPALADQLQLDVEFGWTEAVRKGISLQETAIYSVDDRLTLLPIIASSRRIAPTREEIVETLNTLRKSFDLIILDAAAIDMEAAMITQLPASQLDSGLVVRDRREPNESGFQECVAALRQMGVENIGVADNFIGCP